MIDRENPILQGDALLELIPQRNPIIMVDAFYGMQENESYTSLTLTDNNIFVHNGKFDECGIIEHIAQSCATKTGSAPRRARA